MSIIYRGPTNQLIIAPGESYNETNYGLRTLSRDYVCASSYAASADDILVIGASAAGYTGLSLFTKSKRVDGAITTFSCVFTGHTGERVVTFSQQMRSFSYPNQGGGSISGRYISPTRTVQIARAIGTGGVDSPGVFGSPVVTSVTLNGLTWQGSVGLGTPFPELSSYSEQYYGNTEVVTWTHSIATPFG